MRSFFRRVVVYAKVLNILNEGGRYAMKRFFLWIISVCFALFWAISIPNLTAKADTGPKPSVNVTVTGMRETECYATLLSSNKHFGPYSAYEEGSENADSHYKESAPSEEVFMAFVQYQDADGYYFVGPIWEVENGETFTWGYYPPSPFKALFYFPQEGYFVVSQVYERYAFDSYFEADLMDSGFTQRVIPLQKTALAGQNLWKEGLGLLGRVALTLLLEVGLAFAFKIWKKKPLFLIGGVNVATQLLLNVLLNVIAYFNGSVTIPFYLFLEILVFAAEAIIYCLFINKTGEKRKKSTLILYALAANALSLITGLFLSPFYPAIF